MTLATEISLHRGKPGNKAEVRLGEDRGRTDSAAGEASGSAGMGRIPRRHSPLARKIILFNLLGLVVLVAGVLYLDPFRSNLAIQRERALVSEATLIAEVLQAHLPRVGPVDLLTGDGIDAKAVLAGLSLPSSGNVFVYDSAGNQIASVRARGAGDLAQGSTIISDFLNVVWNRTAGLFSSRQKAHLTGGGDARIRALLAGAEKGRTEMSPTRVESGGFAVAVPIMQNGSVVGVVGVATVAGEIERLVHSEREQVLRMFVIALLVSIGLSLVLASTIANPLSDLAAAAERGRDRNASRMTPERVRIPDLSARPDEIGRLSAALRGMVSALYARIEANEQFAADVAHEIKNPLSSLRSAVETLRLTHKDSQKTKLLDIIAHDVRRLDRLVTDISNASRLDSELVKEHEESFDLMKTLGNLVEFQSAEARKMGVDFIADIPQEPIIIQGLEDRLAQVFVNLVNNALSFCEPGDAVRVWARKRENRVLIVVEDTGPGIPEAALGKIFDRFYSERPVAQFGNHSGLGLAISKQIVEAHGGVIWAENIRPTDADVTSEPLGARFVIGLPI